MRQYLANAKRIVVKIGSSSLTNEAHTVDTSRLDEIVDALTARMGRGTDVIVVSSGAVAAGMGPLGIKQRPTDLATKQAAAAVGQVELAYEWGKSFARYGRTVAQVLLTSGDIGVRDRARNAQRTIDRLRQMGTVPIINENDTVATSEFHFGDNDRLSALVAHLVWADALVLLSDVDGLYDRNPKEPGARFIPEVHGDADLEGIEAGDGGSVGTGGMASKLSAARLASRGGVPVLMTSAASINQALETAQVGTVFHPKDNRLSAWKFWALYAADTAGKLLIDAGAAQAIRTGGTSLLAVGVTGVLGDFEAGKIVDIVDEAGDIVGRGEVGYSAEELQGMIGKKTSELAEEQRRPVVHTDYLSYFAARR